MNGKAIILAAGKGTRLRTEGVDLPKVLREACGKPLLAYVLEALDFLPQADRVLVVGYRAEAVQAAFPEYPAALQEQQLGTGHAVASARELLKDHDGPVLVCCGDMPLLGRRTYEDLMAAHEEQGNVCTLLSGRSPEPLPYGRILRDAAGGFLGVREDKDCSEEERQITELNAGVYVFDSRALFGALGRLNNQNAQGEYYLTDVPGLLKADGGKVGVCCACTGEEMLGVNTVEQLQQVEQMLRSRS